MSYAFEKTKENLLLQCVTTQSENSSAGFDKILCQKTFHSFKHVFRIQDDRLCSVSGASHRGLNAEHTWTQPLSEISTKNLPGG
jgi:hypothetical protein